MAEIFRKAQRKRNLEISGHETCLIVIVLQPQLFRIFGNIIF